MPRACDSPADAARGAGVVLTTVFDAEQAVDVVRRAAPAAATVWLRTTTVGVEGAGHTIAAARQLGLVLVDCPVLGHPEAGRGRRAGDARLRTGAGPRGTVAGARRGGLAHPLAGPGRAGNRLTLERAGQRVPAADVDVRAVATAFGGRAVGQLPDPAGSPST